MHKFQYKAIQYDVSRGRVPKIETIADRFERLKPHGLNMLCLYMECVVQTAVLPGVGCGKTPLTAAYLEELKQLCENNGILLTPIIQVLGHQQTLLAMKAFKWMGELPAGSRAASGNFRIDSGRVRKILFKWLDEILPHFHPPFVHVGCDEVWSLGAGLSRGAIRRLGFSKAVANYLSKFNNYLRQRGLRMMIWPDLAVWHPKLLDLLPKDAILCNWGYGTRDGIYERDNGHFAAHPSLASRGHELWVCGNNHAEYIFPSFQRMNENTRIWQTLSSRFGAKGFIITDWGSNFNVNPHISSVLGDQFILMRLNKGRLSLEEFLRSFARGVLGRRNRNFEQALSLMFTAQQNPRYWPPKIRAFACPFGNMLLDDPAAGGSLARRFGEITLPGIERFLRDMRLANAMMLSVRVRKPSRPDYLRDLVMLSNRLLALALRVRLWYEYAWDSGGPAPGREKLLMTLLNEYLDRSTEDMKWHRQRWREQNLESRLDASMRALANARDSIAAAAVQKTRIPTDKET